MTTQQKCTSVVYGKRSERPRVGNSYVGIHGMVKCCLIVLQQIMIITATVSFTLTEWVR